MGGSEALKQPFAVQFSPAEIAAIAKATEAVWEMCVDFLDCFFERDDDAAINERLQKLKVHPAYWQALKNSWHRAKPDDVGGQY